jgi:type IV pilus assembly protein PilA
MLQTLRKRLGRDEEEGFTLIELMVVVLIIAILIAIAIPTFLGARTRAQDRQAQSNLRNAFAAEKVIYTDDQVYTTSNTALQGVEPSLTYVADASISASSTNTPKHIFVDVVASGANAGRLTIGAKSKSGTCFYMQDSANAPTKFSSNTTCGAPSAQPTLTLDEW